MLNDQSRLTCAVSLFDACAQSQSGKAEMAASVRETPGG